MYVHFMLKNVKNIKFTHVLIDPINKYMYYMYTYMNVPHVKCMYIY